MLEYLALAEWRHIVAETYAAVRNTPEAGRLIAWQDWRARRNDLLKNHPQSPFDDQQRRQFQALHYYDFDPAWRVMGKIDNDVELKTFHVLLGTDGDIHFTRIAKVRFTANGHSGQLSLFWIEGYGGGLFIPFKDASNNSETFGGGRYLYDTIKGVDLGAGDSSIILDFNYAYNPSCAYHSRWVCPLAPLENTLPFHVSAGEKILQLT